MGRAPASLGGHSRGAGDGQRLWPGRAAQCSGLFVRTGGPRLPTPHLCSLQTGVLGRERELRGSSHFLTLTLTRVLQLLGL